MNSIKVAATVILFNPEDCVYDNIKSYSNEVETLIVVDNSTTHNQKLTTKLKKSFQNIIYINNNENIGIATALNIGCEKAIELGYDWILTMDQDSCFLNFTDYLQCLQKIPNPNSTAIIAANTLWNANKYIPLNPTFTYEEKFLVITSANFLNLTLFEEIGKFEDKLFIDMVDHDYCIRVNIYKYQILYFKDILVEHSLGSLFKRKNIFTGKIRNKIEHSPQRAYYIVRNTLYISKSYSKLFPKEFNLLKTINIIFIHEVTKIIIYEDQKIKKIYAKLLGLYHFAKGTFGKFTI